MRFSANVRSDALNQASHVKSPVAGDDTSVGMLSVVCALFALGENVSTVSAVATNATDAINAANNAFFLMVCLSVSNSFRKLHYFRTRHGRTAS